MSASFTGNTTGDTVVVTSGRVFCKTCRDGKSEKRKASPLPDRTPPAHGVVWLLDKPYAMLKNDFLAPQRLLTNRADIGYGMRLPQGEQTFRERKWVAMTQAGKCKVPGCENRVHATGYCRKHYCRIWRKDFVIFEKVPIHIL